MLKKTPPASQDVWQQLADEALDIGRRGDTRNALVMLQHGIDAARLAGERRGEIIAMNGAALMHSIRGDFWASLAASIDAFFLAQQHQDRRGMAHAMAMLAGALLLMTPIDSEINLLRTALKMAEEERDLRLQIRIHNLLGILLGDLEQFDEAEVHLDLSMVLAEGDQTGFDRWRVQANIANLQRKRAQAAAKSGSSTRCAEYSASGLELIARVEDHCREHGKVPILLDALRIAGMLQAVRGQPDLAVTKFAAAWSLAIEKKQRSVLPALGVEIGRMELESGRLNGAESTLSDALREAAQYRPSPKAAGLCELMARLQNARGDERGEAHWLKEAAVARADFSALKLDARRQLARVAASIAPQKTR